MFLVRRRSMTSHRRKGDTKDYHRGGDWWTSGRRHRRRSPGGTNGTNTTVLPLSSSTTSTKTGIRHKKGTALGLIVLLVVVWVQQRRGLSAFRLGLSFREPTPKHPAKLWTDTEIELLNQKYGSSVESILDWVCSTAISQQGLSIAQFTSFGASSLVILDMLQHRSDGCLPAIPVVFIDTVHLFVETYQFLQDVVSQQKDLGLRPSQVHVYQPKGYTRQDNFDHDFGKDLYKIDPQRYGWLTKGEPTQRALEELLVQAWMTGRRRSQGGQRTTLQAFERDGPDRIKINPLVDWTYEQVWTYIQEHELPYNPLYDQGYKSLGDVQTTVKVAPDAEERAGRFQGLNQTECGMHAIDKARDKMKTPAKVSSTDNNSKRLSYIDLDPKLLSDLVLDETASPIKMFLVFHSPYCGHCTRFMPTFIEVANYLQESKETSTKAARYNVVSHSIPDRAKKAGFRVPGVPALFWVTREPSSSSSLRVVKYSGRRDKVSILTWLKDNGAFSDITTGDEVEKNN